MNTKLVLSFNNLAWIALFLVSISTSVLAGKNQKPNIVLIMADDVGLGDIAYYNTEIEKGKAHVVTPALDKLAGEGMWFKDAHSPTALCSPSRYSVMSGNNTYRSYAPWGVWGSFRPNPIKSEDATVGRVAKAAGYATGFIGKWHLGGDFNHKSKPSAFRGNDMQNKELDVDLTTWIAGNPKELGFDYDFTLPTGVQGPIYMAFENSRWYPLAKDSKQILVNDKTALDPKFVSDKGPGMGDSAWDARQINMLLAEKAEQFIQKHAGKRPFLLNYWSPAVHIPHTPPEQINGVAIAGSRVTPHLDMVSVLDYEVAVIVKALKATDSYDNTLIIFTSDNGGLYDKQAGLVGHNSAGNWRGSKNLPYEGGHRVPFIAVWPNTIKAGSRNNDIVNGTDIVATVAAITGVKLGAEQAMDSWNLLPLLQGKKVKKRRELLAQSGSHFELIFRQGDWKLIIQTDAKVTKMSPKALFNLAKNPKELESENLVNHKKHKKRVVTMMMRYSELRDSLVATSPNQ